MALHTDDGDQIMVIFSLEDSDYEARGLLLATDVHGNEIARLAVGAGLVLTLDCAESWLSSGFTEIDPAFDPDGNTPSQDDPWDLDPIDSTVEIDYEPDAVGEWGDAFCDGRPLRSGDNERSYASTPDCW